MKTTERIKMLKAMEYIARKVNDEEVFEYWLMDGIEDGLITIGDLGVMDDDDERLDYYITDDGFRDAMDVFLRLMAKAKKSGGLYCGSIVTKEG